MISGLNSSLSLATRTASEARTRMDKAAREIATGQRVASAKDDSAAWVRANAARIDANARDVIGSTIADARMRQGVKDAGYDMSRQLMSQVRSIALAASAAPAGSPAFNALRDEYITLFTQMVNADHTGRYGVRRDGLLQGQPNAYYTAEEAAASEFQIRNPDGIVTWSGDFRRRESHGSTGTVGTAGPNWYLETAPGARLYYVGAPFSGWTPAFDSPTMAGEIARWFENEFPLSAADDARAGTVAAGLDRAERINIRLAGLSSNLAAALPDADLGKASTALRQNEVRQQLALSTVREAISPYSNFASGLLGNVQSTQRGILA